MRRGLVAVIAVLSSLVVPACLLTVPAHAKYAMPVESYAPYQPQKTCAHKDKPGTVALGRWLVARGGVYGGTLRSCSSGGQSEHKDGRAFDWMLDARSEDDRALADAFLIEAFADDELGDTDALARRMGIMYVIWNDRIYAAWDGFEPKPYLSSGCRTRRTCSVTLRHRDHLHVSLGKAGAQGLTSWYVEQALAPPAA